MKYLTLILTCLCFHTQSVAEELDLGAYTYTFFTKFAKPLDVLHVLTIGPHHSI